MPTPTPTTALLDAALAYAARGWRVIPLHEALGARCSCDKGNDCQSPGKHTPISDWVNKATIDHARIAAWWQRFPNANVGIVTGVGSGIVVIDTDPRHGGDVNLDELQHMYSQLPETPKVLTGGGGTHDYFACTEVLPSCDLAQGIQFQTEGHLVVAPPSLHASGKLYAWEASLDAEDISLAPVPDWVQALALEHAQADTTLLLPDLTHLPSITMADLKISPRLKYVIETGQDPDNPAKYPSRSEALFAVIQGLIRGSHDDATIAAVILNRQWRISDKPWGQRDARSLHYEHSIRQWVGKEILRARAKHHPSTNGTTPPSDTSTTGQHSPAMYEPPLPWSDYTNARALIADHGATLRYCHPWKKWLTWTGSHWNLDDSGTVRQQAKRTIKRLARDVENLDDDKAKALIAHVKKSLSTASLKAMIENAQDEPGIPVLPDVLDSNPWALNCANGTIDLTTGTLTPHTPGHLITRCLAVDYDPDATCPTWDSFLHRIMDGNANLKTFLQQAIGYALTGVIREHVLFILWGTGRNGKSTFLNTLRAMLGAYAIKAPSELLMVSNTDRHPTERADLLGKRFVSAIETEQGRKLAEVFVKEATGGDPIRARRMREDFWEFLPTHKVFLATNHKPVVTGTDTAIWERLRLIPFAVTIPNEDRDTALPDKLNAELPGILAWAVRGCLAWQGQGLSEPKEVLQATAGYRTEMDMSGQFITECCLLGPNYQAKASELYDAYKRWCEQNGEHAETQRSWGMALSARGLERFKVHGLARWRGIAIKPPDWDGNQEKQGDEQPCQVDQPPTVYQKVEEVDERVSQQGSPQTAKVDEGSAIPAHRQHIHMHMRDIYDFSSTSSTSSTCTESPMMEERNEENQIVTCKHTYMAMTDGRRCTRCNALDIGI